MGPSRFLFPSASYYLPVADAFQVLGRLSLTSRLGSRGSLVLDIVVNDVVNAMQEGVYVTWGTLLFHSHASPAATLSSQIPLMTASV